MKVQLLDVNKFISGLIPVTSTEVTTRTGDFHPEGLFSEKIFGIDGTLDRSKRFSYIKLNADLIHPTAYNLLTRIEGKLKTFFSTEQSFSLDSNGMLYTDEESGVTGISEFKKMFPKIQFRSGTSEREKIINVLKEAYKKGLLFINVLPIIPPELRPMYQDDKGKMVRDELNDVYIDIMRKATQIKSVGEGSPLYNLLNFHLQTSVLDHDSFIRKKIGKKHGLIRSTLLGKRVDFSARGVITPGPQLDVNQIGVPMRIAVSLFEPFLIHYILFSKKYPYTGEFENETKAYIDSELSVDTLKRLIKAFRTGDKFPPRLKELLWNACEVVMKGRVVVAKRDPALQDGSYRAFNPVLVDGDTIQLCTLQVTTFNADFDGDAMGLFHPLSNQAQAEAREKMMRGPGSKNMSNVNYGITKEMLVGLYIMTKDVKYSTSPIAVTPEALEKATDPYIPVKFKGRTTTMGRAIFNSVFPPDFEFIDTLVTKKIVNNLIPIIIDKYGDEVAVKAFSKLEKIGFKFATIMAPSITLDMIQMPDSILRIKEKIAGSSPEEASKLIAEAKKLMIAHLKDTGLHDLVESGAGKGWDQPTQMLVAKGVITDAKGNLLTPIEGSFADGLTATEYFSAASGARKGMSDRSLNTATTGYFTRQLVYVLGPVEASATVRDCKTKRYITIRLTKDLMGRLKGRTLIKGSGLETFSAANYKVGDIIKLRSPIFCESKQICHTCYGDLLKRHKTPYVGILAGSLIGERGTQLIMQTFHTGGAATIAQHDILQDIKDNDPLIDVSLINYLTQEDSNLTGKKPCKLTIDLTSYRMNDNIQINEDHVWVNHLICKVEFEDTLFNIILDYPVHIKKVNMVVVSKETITCNYSINDIILEVPLELTEIKEQVNYINRLLGGKVIFKDPSHMISKVLKVYGGSISDLDLVHFEILISQILRDKSNRNLPARLGRTWDPIMMNIKNAVFQSGFVQGLAFENIGKAIETGLISAGEVESSLLGKLVTGEVIGK
jgi:DNA-directed RNA polymerase beta' subunit